MLGRIQAECRRLGPLQAFEWKVRRAGQTPGLWSGPPGWCTHGSQAPAALHQLVLSSRENLAAPEMKGYRLGFLC